MATNTFISLERPTGQSWRVGKVWSQKLSTDDIVAIALAYANKNACLVLMLWAARAEWGSTTVHYTDERLIHSDPVEGRKSFFTPSPFHLAFWFTSRWL